MSNSLRAWCAVLAFLSTVAIGCSKHVATPGPSYHRVMIGPTETTANPELQELVKAFNDQAYWIAIDSSGTLDTHRLLYIDFETQDVFPESKPVTVNGVTRYRVRCSGAYCQSGPIGQNAREGQIYPYWQTLVTTAGAENSADGRIVIVRP